MHGNAKSVDYIECLAIIVKSYSSDDTSSESVAILFEQRN